MSASEKKGSSCFGLFVKSWILSALAMAAMSAAVVGLGIHYFGWSSQSWSDFSAWNTYPMIAMITISVLSTGVAFAVAAFIGVASAFLSKGGKSKASSAKPKARPQSSRKTTV